MPGSKLIRTVSEFSNLSDSLERQLLNLGKFILLNGICMEAEYEIRYTDCEVDNYV